MTEGVAVVDKQNFKSVDEGSTPSTPSKLRPCGFCGGRATVPCKSSWHYDKCELAKEIQNDPLNLNPPKATL